ncbi:MAG: SseB family protein [Clostridiales bacterium]|nr:SseB family protein [Clostridiales bacterium]
MEMGTKLRFELSEQERDRETMLSFMVERQHDNPNQQNYNVLINALKDAHVYVPVNFNFTEAENRRIASDIKAGRPVRPSNNMSFSPQLLIHRETGEKVMPWFTREFEFASSAAASEQSFVRIPVAQIVQICDNMPDAFDILIDAYTHPYKISLDSLLEGLNSEAGEGVNVLNDDF